MSSISVTMNNSRIFFAIAFAFYVVISKIVFDNVYLTSKLIVDEEFHLPLGEKYCNFNFKEWDPKVTTLPGLYLISSLILGPSGLCSIYWLRSISLIFSCVNLILLYIIFSETVVGEWQKVFTALMVTLLPPLYFLSFVYYTDIVSLTSILLFVILNSRSYHYSASIAGFLSIICRQTNVIFIAIFGGRYVLTELYASWVQKKDSLRKDGKFPVRNLRPFITDLLTDPMEILNKTTTSYWLNSLSYISVLLVFALFLVTNGAIVVGDRSAHSITVNIPQLFYFSLFSLFFGWPHFVGEILNFAHFARRHKTLVLFLTIIAISIVRFNTVVHPYLLADNRHFIFYVWNRFFVKYWWFKYALVPVYIFSLYVIIKTLWDATDISFFLLFTLGSTILLVSQSLLEVRYFFVPYILIRFRMKNTDSAVFNVVLEFVTYSIINIITLNIFFNKVLYWRDMDYPQRIIW